MQEGTRIGHVAEHVAIQQQSRIGIAVTRGKTRPVRGCPGVRGVMIAH